MKKLVPLLSFVIAFAACHNPDNKNNSGKSGKTDPIQCGKNGNYFLCAGDSLNLTGTILTTNQSAVYISNGKNCIEICLPPNHTNCKQIPVPVVSIPYNLASALNDSANKLKGNSPPPHYVTGVEIIFGVDSSTFVFKYFFKPLFMPGTVSNGVGTYSFTNQDTTFFYKVDSTGTCVKATFAEVKKDTCYFRQCMQIKYQPGNPGFHPFKNCGGDSGSTRYVIYPMQEIAGMFGSSTTGTINLINTAREYHWGTNGADSILKQDVMLSITIGNLESTTTNNDMSHLVPPATTLTYSVVTRPGN
ncbi:MAG TPA: hypothetical protein VK808_06290 [Bacteroidia bacterium]|jgi:hypothetical protein|nr:hypothetical protein [Bacteroidia bacterium]